LADNARRVAVAAGVLDSGAPGRTKTRTLFQRGMELNAEMNMVMTERFNVSGAMW